MAVQKVEDYGVEDLPEEYTCEFAEIGTLPTDIPTHSTCWVLDDGEGNGGYALIFDGTSWREV